MNKHTPHRNIYGLILGILLIPLYCIGDTSITKDTLQNLPSNTWVKVAPPPPAPRGILSYSGGVYDPENRKFLLFGGGHNNYWGNEVYAFDLDTLEWEKMYEPDSRDRYTRENIDDDNGKLRDSDKPFTRHTYQMLVYAPPLKGMFIWSGAGPGWKAIGTSRAPRDAWVYRYKENKWELLATGGPRTFGGGTCYDPKRAVIWAARGTGQREQRLLKFDPANRQWTRYTLKEFKGHKKPWHNTLACATDYDTILFVGGSRHQTWLIDTKTLTATKIDTPFQSDPSGGLVYHPKYKVAIHLGTEIWAYFDFTKRRWYELPSLGLPPTRPHGIWGRLAYVPVENVLIAVTRYGVFVCNFQLPDVPDE